MVLLNSAYWPNLHYFIYLINYDKVSIDVTEPYAKQTYRNRTQILSTNGVLNLSIPVKKFKSKTPVNEIELSYAENWQINHWRAITSAYSNSPYFEYFEEDIKPFYYTKYNLLIDYNKDQLKTLFKLLKLKTEINFIDGKQINSIQLDLRKAINPKNEQFETVVNEALKTPYYQTFSDKFGFKANLSILDLLFNTGLDSINYLKTTSELE
ncbi:MAG: WbqC family protein [Bacteroidia bacterium]|nr:WbqC family protein [Bacteroidia bacterium]